MIDREIGTAALGIWDLCWSLVNYISIFVIGSGSSVSRFVAHSQSDSNSNSFARVVSSAFPTQVAAALLIAGLTALVVYSLPAIYGRALGPEIASTRWVVALLGFGLAVQMGLRPFRGVITGCHRWDIHNAMHAAESILSAGAMIFVLYAGFELVGLAIAYLSVMLATDFVRALIAFRICDELKIGRTHWDRSTAIEMLLFDAKTMLSALPRILVGQTTRLFIVGALGPVALAIIARPMALIDHSRTIVNKFAVVMTPVAASLQGSGRETETPVFLVESVYYSAAIALPMLIFMAMYGDHVMLVWMGPKYVNHELLLLLTIGQILPIVQSPVIRVMMGLNLHGKLSVVNAVLQLGGLCGGLVVLHWVGWSLLSSAMLIVIPQLLSSVAVPYLACRKLGVTTMHFYLHALGKPVLIALAFAIILGVTQQLVGEDPIQTLLIGALAGGITTVMLYWKFLLTVEGRNLVLKLLRPKKRI
jgi:O-antigen/teichoic acid export membrane protein